MLTQHEIDFLSSKGKPVKVRKINGAEIVVGGEAQYSADLATADVNQYRESIKAEFKVLVDELMTEKSPETFSRVYSKKLTQAQMYKEAGYPTDASDYKFLLEEAAERGVTAKQLADSVISAAATSDTKAARIERRRIKFNLAADSATTLEQLHTLKTQTLDVLRGL